VLFCLYNHGNMCSCCGEIVFGDLGVTNSKNMCETRDRQLCCISQLVRRGPALIEEMKIKKLKSFSFVGRVRF
jgi:hypothetical protein